MERLLPYNIEAEEGVLGSLILDPEAIPQVADFLRPEDFYRDAHRQIYAAVIDLHRAHTPADLITLCEELDRRGQLKAIGGTASVSSLVNAVPTSANVEYYASIVERAAMMRRLIHAAGQMAALAYNEQDPREALEQSMRLLLRISDRHQDDQEQDFEEVLDELLEETYNRMEGSVSQHLLQTGLPALNAAVSGIDRGELVYLAGRPGSGKSVLGLAMADAAAGQVKEQGGTVFYYTLEMSATQQVRRLVAARARINTQLIRTGFRGAYGELAAEELARFNQKAQALRERLKGTLFIHKKPISVDRLYERLYNAVLTKNCQFVVIDQLDLLEDERREREHDQISYASKRLKQIARELNLPILCLVQLNREVEHRHGLAEKRPILPDFRYSGRLEQDADQVWFLFRPSMYEARPQDCHWAEYGEIILGKMRDGQRGLIVPYRFLEPYASIEDWPGDWERPIVA
jgi:replicative DNA helicase